MKPAPEAPPPEGALTAMDEVLRQLGYDTDAEAALTSSRFTQLLADFAPKHTPPPLSPCVVRSTDPILLRDLPFYSLCVHHLLPFFGAADVVHLPVGPIAGLGSFSKSLRFFARQPQLQERLGARLADHLHAALGGTILVRLRARHLCMEMRGEESRGEVTSMAVRGPDAALALSLLR